jgi:hypothetical protein
MSLKHVAVTVLSTAAIVALIFRVGAVQTLVTGRPVGAA